jgi:hypothetical protein
VIFQDGKKVTEMDFDWTNLPDPVAQALQCLLDRVDELEKDLEELKGRTPQDSLADVSSPLRRDR